MKLLKPAFVHNQDRPIFSIDLHPNEAKFATVQQQQLQNSFPGFIELILAGWSGNGLGSSYHLEFGAGFVGESRE